MKRNNSDNHPSPWDVVVWYFDTATRTFSSERKTISANSWLDAVMRFCTQKFAETGERPRTLLVVEVNILRHDADDAFLDVDYDLEYAGSDKGSRRWELTVGAVTQNGVRLQTIYSPNDMNWIDALIQLLYVGKGLTQFEQSDIALVNIFRASCVKRTPYLRRIEQSTD